MPDAAFNAWNPGLSSEIPARLLPLTTLFRPENSKSTYAEAQEDARFCGLRPQDMALLNVPRLAMHEVLIRVTADLYVPDGPNYEELGLNLRGMAERILSDHVGPKMDALAAEFEALMMRAKNWLATRLETDIYARNTDAPDIPQSFLGRVFGKKPPPTEAPEPAELIALRDWDAELPGLTDPFEKACLEQLRAVVGGIVGQRGRLMADKDVIIRLASGLIGNSYGSQVIGRLIDPILREAATAEGYRLLPYQTEPFVMNVKGASAAGKSTIRPVQRELAGRVGVPWEDFALVSPDYWRKFMLDYDSLGDDFKYAAMLTGQELEIIDKKLDIYMAEKAARGEMPHLLIDRFRFDSFEPTSIDQGDGRLLSRFGHTVFMFFIITPPTETVVRAWNRGKTTGRFKAVDDLLYHNIEAYTGMPQLFLNWVNKTRQKVHFEFLDNDVPFGERPRTVAFGWNRDLTILDPSIIRNMTRYQHVNVEAVRPEDVYLDDLNAEDDILKTFIEKIPVVTFVAPDTEQVNARFENKVCVYGNAGFLDELGLDGEVKGGAQITFDAEQEKAFTLGVWGSGGQ